MKNSTNKSSIRRPAAEHGRAVRRFAALAFAALALAVVLPAHAFQKTSLADGSFEYFFATPSLDIRGGGDLDLAGLSFIEGVEGGFRVGASFNLDWMGGEQAVLASPASTWSGLDILPHTLSIAAGGNLNLGTTRFTLSDGNISLTAGGALTIGDGSLFDIGNTGGPVSGELCSPFPFPPRGSITLTGPSPVPEPTTAALLLVGLAGLAGVFGRRANAGR